MSAQLSQPKAEVAANYLSGVEAIETVTAGLSEAAWGQPACGSWDATQTARHLVGVIGWYHEWLARARDGDFSPPFSESEFDVRNEEALSALNHLSGPHAVSTFVASARSYLDDASGDWSLPFGYPGGSVTVGQHLGIAAVEWHLHAWDLNTEHRPTNAESLFIGAGACVAAAKGGLAGRGLSIAVPLAAKREPWKRLVKESGRS